MLPNLKMRRRSVSDCDSSQHSTHHTGFNILLLLKTRRQARRIQQQSTAIEVVKGHMHDIGTDLKIHRGKVDPSDVRSEIEAGAMEMPFMIFHPFSTWRLGWDVLIMFFLFYSLITVPVRIAFEEIHCSNNFYAQTFFWYVDLALDMCFIMDVLIGFRTAYLDVSENAENKIVTSQRAIAKKYASGFLFFDIISSIPFDLILLMVSCDTVNGANRILRSPKALKIIRLVRLLRLLRISRLQVFLRKVNDMLQINPGLLRLLRFIFLVCLAFHYNSCIFFFIGEYFAETHDGEHQGSWTTASKTIMAIVDGEDALYRIHDLQAWQQYLVSLYWTVTTMTTVGWGDFTPVTVPEVMFTLLVLLQGGATFSYMVGNMASLISRISPRTIKYRAREELWEHFYHRENISHEMRRRIRNYEAYMYREPLANLPTFARRELSSSLLREITGHIYSKALHSLKIFKGLDEYCLTHLALALKPVQLPPGEVWRLPPSKATCDLCVARARLWFEKVVYKEGDFGNCMFFLHTGEVEFSMLLMSEAEKVKMGVKNVGDSAFTDSFIKRNQRQQSHDVSHSSRAFRFTRIATGWKELGNRKLALKPFTWRMHADSKHASFGESVLTSTTGVRLSTVRTTTWTVLFLLDRDKLREVVNRIPAMKVVWANIKKHRTSRMVRAVSRVVQSMRTRYNDTGRLYVEIQKGVHLPRTDGFLGKCDGFCTLQRDGEDVEDKRVFHTRVQYSTFSPEWNETFLFPVQEGRGGVDINIKISLYDHNMIGQHQFIGYAMLDATDLCWHSFDDDTEHSESRWLTVRKISPGGVPLAVKGTSTKGKESLTKIKVGLRTVPPPQKSESPETEQPRRRRRTSSLINKEGLLNAEDSADTEKQFRDQDVGTGDEKTDEGDRQVRCVEERAQRKEEGGAKTESEDEDSRQSGAPLGKRVLFDVSDDVRPLPEPAFDSFSGIVSPPPEALDFSRAESNVSSASVDSSRSDDVLASTTGLRSGAAQMLAHGPAGTDSGLLLLCGVSDMTGGSLFAFDKSAASAPLREDVGGEWWTRLIPRGSQDAEAHGDAVYKNVLDSVLRSQHREREEVQREMSSMAHRLHEMEVLLRAVTRRQQPKPERRRPRIKRLPVMTAALPTAGGSSESSGQAIKKLAPLVPLPPKLNSRKQRARTERDSEAAQARSQGKTASSSPSLNGNGGASRDFLRPEASNTTPRYRPPPGHQS